MVHATETGRPRILVVEDNYFVANEICAIIENCGFSVAGPVARVDLGMNLLAERKIEGAIVDINLRGTLCYPICDELQRRDVPYLFLSGYERSAVPAAYRDVRFLAKPLVHNEIKTALAELRPFVNGASQPRLPTPAPTAPRSLLIDSMGNEDREVLHRLLKPVALKADDVVEQGGRPCLNVWFPVDGLLSTIVESKGRRMDVGFIGREGMTGLDIVLNGGECAYRTIVRFGGSALRAPAQDFAALLAQRPGMQRHVLAYVHSYLRQLARNVLVAGKGTTTERVAHWLLMVTEGLGTDQVHVTHAGISEALGVRRAGVTVALHRLEGVHAIRATRQLVNVVDRGRLSAEAGGLHGIAGGSPTGGVH